MTRSQLDGTFFLAGIPSQDGSGADRTVTVEAVGGRSFLPVRATAAATLISALVDTGDILHETFDAATLRLLHVTRGERTPHHDMAIGPVRRSMVSRVVGDSMGEMTLYDVGQDIIGYHTSRPRNLEDVFVTHGTLFFQPGHLLLEESVFAREIHWLDPGRSTTVIVLDRQGGVPIFEAPIMAGATPGAGFSGVSRLDGSLPLDKDVAGQATAAIRTVHGNRTVVSAFSMITPFGIRAELPLERVHLSTGSAFDRHGLVAGDLLAGTGGVVDRRVRAHGPLTLSGWYDEVFFGENRGGSVPVDIDPAVTGSISFRIGVPAPLGFLAGVEGTTSIGVFTLEEFGFSAITPTPGTLFHRDIDLAHQATATFTVPGAITNLHSTLAPADLRFDLGVLLDTDLVVDVARQIGGNLTPSGQDLSFRLPPLAGALTGQTYLVAYGAVGADGLTTVEQRSFADFDGAQIPQVDLLPVPDITAPAPGATVSATGFTVQWTTPIGTTYVEIELRSSTPTDERVWRVLLPPGASSFAFRELPPELPDPLIATRTWTLEVAAYRVGRGPVAQLSLPYFSISSHYVGLSPADLQVDALSRRTLTLTSN